MQTDGARTGQVVDLSHCDKEPIHIPGGIQPHGMLLVLQAPALTICQVSENAEALLGVPARALLGTGFETLLVDSQAASIRACLLAERLEDNNPLELTTLAGGQQRFFNGIAHRHQGRLILELEPTAGQEAPPFFGFYHQARSSMSRLRDAMDLRALCQEAVREVRRLTGFDRVIAYRFDEEWNGAVLAEDRLETADSYLGMWFPASDIQLERSNVELDSFAYAASHDLKEPLRGIHNYASLVLREQAGDLAPTNLKRMETVVRLTQRMESLINSLLHYAQVGRTELSVRETDLNEVLASVLEVLKPRIDEAQVEVRVPRPLPPAPCDRVRMAEVFTNLLTNAIKYNDKEKKWVELGAMGTPDGGTAYYVRDNGIGIKPEYHDTIFRIFKRLHGRDKYGGGTGTGLTIVKRLIERQNGRLWLESQPGVGTTFFFTLGSEKAEPVSREGSA